jgi:hypothetical protein
LRNRQAAHPGTYHLSKRGIKSVDFRISSHTLFGVDKQKETGALLIAASICGGSPVPGSGHEAIAKLTGHGQALRRSVQRFLADWSVTIKTPFTWIHDRREILRRFPEILLRADRDELEAIIRALNQHDCWHEAVGNLCTGASPNKEMGDALISFWYTYGLWSIPRGLKENIFLLADAFKYLMPPYAGSGLTLYRGELEARHRLGIYGIAWTPHLKTAQVFADRRYPDEGQGVVLKIEATQAMIVASLRDHSAHTTVLEEDEYFVDPRKIRGTVSVV